MEIPLKIRNNLTSYSIRLMRENNAGNEQSKGHEDKTATIRQKGIEQKVEFMQSVLHCLVVIKKEIN